MKTAFEIIKTLNSIENKEIVQQRRIKFGIITINALGVTLKDLNAILKYIKKSDNLALELYDTGIHEAQILCAKMFNPKNVTEVLMEKWVKNFDNWATCDCFCMCIFAKSSFNSKKIIEWSTRNSEFEKRAAFATLAALCVYDKKSHNDFFLPFFTIITNECKDDRLYVKKSISWALRSLGKRNLDLHKHAVKIASSILKINNKNAHWIAKDVLKELEGSTLRISHYPRHRYEKKQ